MAKLKRIKFLEANDEEWFKYYFPNFYTSEPADFHFDFDKSNEAGRFILCAPGLGAVQIWADNDGSLEIRVNR